MTSAYPIPTDALEDRVRALASSLGEWPAQRRVMRECRVGATRAAAALAAVKESGFDPTASLARPLTVVPNPPTPTDENLADTASADDPERGRTRPGTPAAEDTDTRSAAAIAPDHGEHARVEHRSGPVADDRAEDDDHTAARPGADVGVSQVADAAETPADTSVDTPTEAGGRARSARLPRWPLLVIAAGAFVAIWGGWVGLGELTGFGPIRLLPGIADEFVINSAITLPLGMEAYAAFALRAWLAPPSAGLSATARRFACVSALGALALGAAGQIAYHLMVAAGITQAPWPITAFVACLPVIVLGCGAALTHLIHHSVQEG